jgi:hypothetical protein
MFNVVDDDLPTSRFLTLYKQNVNVQIDLYSVSRIILRQLSG